MHNATAIFKKQIKDTLKNKTVLIQFVMFPILTLVMSNAIKLENMPKNFFVLLFATMYMAMAPLTSIAAIISEEREKNTLRVLLMSNVKPNEYITGIGLYIWLACMLGSGIICISGNYSLKERIYFMLIMALGILTSLLVGAAIGTWSKTQMMATSITIPVMMIFSFLPMLSLFNDTIAKVAKYTYTEQIRLMLSKISEIHFSVESFCILAVNIFIFTGMFLAAYKHKLFI